MPPTARKSTPPADLASKRAANAKPAPAKEKPADLDAMRAEVEAEPDSVDVPFVVPLGDTSVRVKPILDWPISSDELLFGSRFTQWAEKILADDDFTNVWVKVDPTLRQVIRFVSDLEAATGIPFGLQYTSQTS